GDGLLREPTRLQEGEQFSETVDGDSVDIQGFASQFAERVEQDGRDETRLPKLAGDQFEQLVHSLLDELVSLLFMNRVLACETGLGDVRPFGRCSRMRSRRSRVTRIGGTSVSGYIRAFPGRGRLYTVVPSGRGSRVSGGTPSIAAAARGTISPIAPRAFSSSSATSTNASCSPIRRAVRAAVTSDEVIP